MLGWYIGVIGIFVGVGGGIYFAKSLSRLAGELRWSLSNLVIASFVYIIFSSIMVTLGTLQEPITTELWQLVPILFFISTVFYISGALQLVKLLTKIPEKKVTKGKR